MRNCWSDPFLLHNAENPIGFAVVAGPSSFPRLVLSVVEVRRESLNQFSTDNINAVADEAYDVRRVDFDVAAIDHHID